MCVCHCVQCLWRPEESVRCAGAGVTDSCELPDVGAGEFQYCGRAASALNTESSLMPQNLIMANNYKQTTKGASSPAN